MIKLDIVNQVAEKTGLSRIVSEMAVNALFDAMRKAMLRRDRIELRGFGVFTVRDRKKGIGRNPRTGEEASIAPGLTVRFKPGKEITPEIKSIPIASPVKKKASKAEVTASGKTKAAKKAKK